MTAATLRLKHRFKSVLVDIFYKLRPKYDCSIDRFIVIIICIN